MNEIILDVEPKSLESRIKQALDVLMPICFTATSMVILRETTLTAVHRAIEDREIQDTAFVEVRPLGRSIHIRVRGALPGEMPISYNDMTKVETIHSN